MVSEQLPSDMDSIERLPSDMLFNILSRLPSLRTLDTSKAVCKTWNGVIHETSFMPTYCQRTKNLSGYFIQGIKKNKDLSMFVTIDQSDKQQQTDGSSSVTSDAVCIERLPDCTKILASCNQGILCCEKPQRHCNYRYYVCKPATKQWQALPNPKLRYRTVAVAIMVFSSSPFSYKIVRLSYRGIIAYQSKYTCEIFNSKTWAWKETIDIDLPYEELLCRSSPVVSVGNSLYLLTSQDNVLVFHESEGIFQKFPLPDEVVQDNSNFYRYKKLIVYQRRLGLIYNKAEGNTELWITEENSRNGMAWRKVMVMDVQSLVTDVTYPSLVDFYNDGIAFLNTADNAVVFYKLEDGNSSIVKIDNDLRFACEVFGFRSDLEHVNLGRDC